VAQRGYYTLLDQGKNVQVLLSDGLESDLELVNSVNRVKLNGRNFSFAGVVIAF
jgi:hypothetical protein